MSEHMILRFDGPRLTTHEMDVADLAPALMALGDLCKAANQALNGERATVRVVVRADLEQHCFEVAFKLVLDTYEQLRGLFADDRVQTAKEILEWLGLLGVSAVGGHYGVLQVLAWLKGREPRVVIDQTDAQGSVVLMVNGDHNQVTVAPEVATLVLDPAVVRKSQQLVAPLHREGYESLEFETARGTTVVDRTMAADIAAYRVPTAASDTPENRQIFTAWITVYSPVYDRDSKSWRFRFGDAVVAMDITETDIADRAVERGGALIEDRYLVRLEITQRLTANQRIENRYKILDVLEFQPARPPQQGGLAF